LRTRGGSAGNRRLLTVFVAHAPENAEFTQELNRFLETGCDVSVFGQEGMIGPGDDLISVSETGLSADILILLLSRASNHAKWIRERWEPVLSQRAAELDTRVAVLLLEECTFPGLLRRGGHFFDATADRLGALRKLKRWIWGIRLGTEPALTHSPDLEDIYTHVADRVGTFTAPAADAERFAREANREFEAVLWVPAHRRTLAQIVCEAGSQLGLNLSGPVDEDCRVVQNLLSQRRCLLILDASTVAVDALLPHGRTSVLFTSEPAKLIDEPASPAAARRLLAAGRVSEAYEMLIELMETNTETEWCARELIWIYEQWDRMEDANKMRFLVSPLQPEQLGLLF
jgi:hypothetical protein